MKSEAIWIASLILIMAPAYIMIARILWLRRQTKPPRGIPPRGGAGGGRERNCRNITLMPLFPEYRQAAHWLGKPGSLKVKRPFSNHSPLRFPSEPVRWIQ